MATADGPGPFGGLLQQYRAAAGLSQEELAERAGLSRRGISDLERGQRRAPHPATIRRLADALNLGEPERADIAQLLANPACRLVTLVGPGGIGKTRLALAAAGQHLASSPGEVCFV